MIDFKNTRIPSTPEDWQLYTVSMKCGAAARSLTAALKKAMTKFPKLYKSMGGTLGTPWFHDRYDQNRKIANQASYEALKQAGFYEARNKYAKYGAADSEPRHVVLNAMSRYASQLIMGEEEAYFID